jgi:hydrogenase-4 component E
MSFVIEPILIALLLGNLALLGTSRLALYIRILGVQGMLLGTLPLLLEGSIHVRVALLALCSVGIKGVLFPQLLFRTMRAANVRHEVEPFIGYSVSVLAGVITLGLSFWLADRLQLPTSRTLPLILPAALFTVFTGLFLIVTRRKALTQVMGYLLLENGIYLFGITLAREEPFLVEMGILLDVLVAVFLMGIAIFHISREFDHIDVDQLSTLKDWVEP